MGGEVAGETGGKVRSIGNTSKSFSYDSTTTSRPPFQIFFANVTFWGPRVVAFCENEQADVLSVVEHHLLDTSSLRRDALSFGRDFHGTKASPSGKSVSGTSAGVGILPKRHLAVVPPEPQSLSLSVGLSDPTSARWYPLSIRLKGVTVTYIVAYLFSAEGLSTRNQDILQQIYTYMQLTPGPFILAGDWQVHPAELVHAGWLTLLNVQHVIPTGLTATCRTSGGNASLIDFYLVSPCLISLVSVQPVFDVPWKPHIGLRLTIVDRPRVVLTPSIRTPKPLPPLPVDDEGEHTLQHQVWEESCRLAASFISHKSSSGVINLSSTNAAKLSSTQLHLAQRFGRACTSMEIYTCLSVGISKNKLSPYLGRGHFPSFSLRPLVHRSFLSSRYSCPHANFWAKLESCLGWLLTDDYTSSNTLASITSIKQLSVSLGFHWSSAAAPNCPVHAWSTWAQSLTTSSVSMQQLGYSTQRIETWKTRAGAQKHLWLKSAVSISRLRFQRWLADAVSNSISTVHNLVKADKPPVVHTTQVQAQFDPWQDAWNARWCGSDRPLSSDSCVRWVPWSHQLSSIIDFIAANQPPDDTPPCSPPATFNVNQFKAAAVAYPSKKKLGSDFLATKELSMLPSAVVEPFVDILNSIHHIGLWPPQLLLNLFSLIPKSLGGSRAIAKTPIFYRLWCLMRSEVIRDWSRETCPDWEYAAAGRNCLSAAATHQWVNELAHASGNVSAALLWDIWKYFDSINYEDVTRVASKLQYPTSDLKLALQMHAAPRILQMSGISSMAMKPFRSILQGCFHSGFIARMITHFPVERIYKEQRDEGFRRPATTHFRR